MLPPSIFYTRQRQRPFNERHLKDIEGTRQMMDWFGAAPICFEPRCRRAGRCAGDPRQGRFFMPPCFGHYREELRFFVAAVLHCPEFAEQVHPKRGRTVIAAAYGEAAPILERLRRSPHVPGPGAGSATPTPSSSTSSRATGGTRTTCAGARGSRA